MTRLITWLKSHKLSTFLIIVVVLLLAGQLGDGGVMRGAELKQVMRNSAGGSSGFMGTTSVDTFSAPVAQMSDMVGVAPIYNESAPTPDITDRMIVTNSYLSLVVADVADAVEEAKTYTSSMGGYFVNSSINRPEEGGMGTLSLRIPADTLDEALTHFRNGAVTVVSEDLSGTDVTDQYVDNDERLRVLEANKARFEQIMAQATDIDDIVRVQREIFSLQSQIESIKGRQQYMEQTSKMALVTLYLSTDELSLPYAPADTWRPEVIFKTAVRSLVSTFRDMGTKLIWIGVYAIIWLPLLIIGWLIYRRRTRRKPLS